MSRREKSSPADFFPGRKKYFSYLPDGRKALYEKIGQPEPKSAEKNRSWKRFWLCGEKYSRQSPDSEKFVGSAEQIIFVRAF